MDSKGSGVAGASPKTEKKLPLFLKIEEVSELINAPDLSTRLGRRDRALFEVLYGCGLRVSEAVGLDFEHLDLKAGWIRVTGKGAKERMVPFGGPAREALTAYLQDRETTPLSLPLFVNFRGSRLSARSVARILAKHWSGSLPSLAWARVWAVGWERTSLLTASGTALPPTSWRRGRTCVRFKSCSGTHAFRRHNAILIWIWAHLWMTIEEPIPLTRGSRID